MSEVSDAPWQDAFLTALAAGSTVAHACKAARVPRSTAYSRRHADEAFAVAWDDAIEAGTDELEEVAIRRAKDHSDTLLIFMLKARRPEKFKDRAQHELTGKNEGPVQIGRPTGDEVAKAIADLLDQIARIKASGAPVKEWQPALNLIDLILAA